MKFMLFDHPNMSKPNVWIDVEKISSFRVTGITSSTLEIALLIQGTKKAEIVVTKPAYGGDAAFFDAIGVSADAMEESYHPGD
ncbi:hypothetical protein [Hyphococcus sp.]|uniref:hypothetical protein n=1 Tax=Hyphococcus sp. TaxID=2038636 RepID=UPI00207F7AEE|nr:MAG: hypothetical protein DHS20C04_30560 [Marinicaulis sp.]